MNIGILPSFTPPPLSNLRFQPNATATPTQQPVVKQPAEDTFTPSTPAHHSGANFGGANFEGWLEPLYKMDLLKETGGVIFHEALEVFMKHALKPIEDKEVDPNIVNDIYAIASEKHNVLEEKGTALLISEEAGVNTPFVQAFIDNLSKYAKAVDFKQFGVTHKVPKSDDKLFLKITKTPQEPKVLEQLGWEQVEGTETDYILNLRKQQDQVRAIAEKFINPTDDFSTIDYPALMEQLFAPFHSAIEPLLSETQNKTEFAEFVIKPEMLSPIISENFNKHLNKTHGFSGGYAGGYGYKEVVPVY